MTYRNTDLETENEWLKKENLALLEKLESKSKPIKIQKPEKPWTPEQRKHATEAAFAFVVIFGFGSLIAIIFSALSQQGIFVICCASLALLFAIELFLRLTTGHWAWWRGITASDSEHFLNKS